MTLRALPPGLPPDEVEKLRWQTYGHMHANALTSADALAHFIVRRGFVLTRPQRGLHFPSALEAVVGRPLLGRSFDPRTAQLEAWRRECLATGKLHTTASLRGHDTLVAPQFFVEFLALAAHNVPHAADSERAARGLSPDATAICQHLAKAKRPLAQAELEERMRLRSDPGRARLRKALDEAIRRLCVCEVVIPHEPSEDDSVFDLVPRAFHAQLEEARGHKTATARQRIATRYLRNVLVEGSHEMARVLGWTAQDTLDTLHALESRKIASEHPASRHNRWFFQANATDLLA